MLRIVEFEGKRYPRYWGHDFISLSEAMARMGAKECSYYTKSYISICTNITDAPEGVMNHDVRVNCIDDRPAPAHYTVYKKDIDVWLKAHNLPPCDNIEPRAEEKADLEIKERKMIALKYVAAAAAFAIEQAKGDNDGVSNELRAHWSAQEHAYLLAQEEVEVAKKVLSK